MYAKLDMNKAKIQQYRNCETLVVVFIVTCMQIYLKIHQNNLMQKVELKSVM